MRLYQYLAFANPNLQQIERVSKESKGHFKDDVNLTKDTGTMLDFKLGTAISKYSTVSLCNYRDRPINSQCVYCFIEDFDSFIKILVSCSSLDIINSN